MQALPHHLNTFADALLLVPAPARAAEAKAIIREAADLANRHNAMNAASETARGYAVPVAEWGNFLQPVCLNRLNARPLREFARIDTRDGLQAWETAIYALTDMVREAEQVAA